MIPTHPKKALFSEHFTPPRPASPDANLLSPEELRFGRALVRGLATPGQRTDKALLIFAAGWVLGGLFAHGFPFQATVQKESLILFSAGGR